MRVLYYSMRSCKRTENCVCQTKKNSGSHFLGTELEAYGWLRAPPMSCDIAWTSSICYLICLTKVPWEVLLKSHLRLVFSVKNLHFSIISFILWLRHKLFAAYHANDIWWMLQLLFFIRKSLFSKLRFMHFIVSMWQGQGWTNYNYTGAWIIKTS